LRFLGPPVEQVLIFFHPYLEIPLMKRSWIRNLFASPSTGTIRKAPPRAQPALEALEDRTVLSVSVVLNGHALTIVDSDTSGHTINVNQTATQDQFTVQVDAGPISTFNSVAKIKVDLGADSDTLNFNNNGFATCLSGNLSVNAGDGDNNVVIGATTILGNVSVTEGNGSNYLQVGDITLDPHTAPNISIHGNLSVSQGDGSDTVFAVGSIDGNVSMIQGNGSDTLFLGSLSFVIIDGDFHVIVVPLQVNGNLSTTQGNGENDAVIMQIDTVGGNLAVNQGNGAFDSYFTLADSIGGNLSVTEGNGESDFYILQFVTVGRNLSVNQGNGNGDFGSSQVIVAGNAAVTQGDGDGDYTEFYSQGDPNTIGGNLSVTQGNGEGDTINFDGMTVFGNATFRVGNGSGDTINIASDFASGVPETFTQDVSIFFGNGGGATLNVGTDGDPVTFGGKASFFAGGSGNTYTQDVFAVFEAGQPKLHGF
jgi:hypothetical protein